MTYLWASKPKGYYSGSSNNKEENHFMQKSIKIALLTLFCCPLVFAGGTVIDGKQVIGTVANASVDMKSNSINGAASVGFSDGTVQYTASNCGTNYVPATNFSLNSTLAIKQNVNILDGNGPGNPHGTCNKGDIYFVSTVLANPTYPCRIYRFNNINNDVTDYTSATVIGSRGMFQILYDSVNDCIWGCTQDPDRLVKIDPSTLAVTTVATLPYSGLNATIVQDANYIYYGTEGYANVVRYSKVDYSSTTLATGYDHHNGVLVSSIDRLIMSGPSGYDVIAPSTFTLVESIYQPYGTITDDATWIANETGMFFLFGCENYINSPYGGLLKIKVANYNGGSYSALANTSYTVDGNVHRTWGVIGGGAMSVTNCSYYLFSRTSVCKPVYSLRGTSLDVIIYGPGGSTYYAYYSIPQTHNYPLSGDGGNEFFQSSTGQKFYTTYDTSGNPGWSLTEVVFDEWALTNTLVVTRPIQFTGGIYENNGYDIATQALQTANSKVSTNLYGEIPFGPYIGGTNAAISTDGTNLYFRNVNSVVNKLTTN
jgi:hypothetical protein